MFSIIIPTLNNLEYLRLCIKSLRNNSSFSHQIISHVNIGEDGTVDFLKKENIEYTFTKYNAGICEGMNMASKKAKKDFILYAHDDFYFCPKWDLTLKNEIDKIGHKKALRFLRALIKSGNDLLSHLLRQYHRRRRA